MLKTDPDSLLIWTRVLLILCMAVLFFQFVISDMAQMKSLGELHTYAINAVAGSIVDQSGFVDWSEHNCILSMVIYYTSCLFLLISLVVLGFTLAQCNRNRLVGYCVYSLAVVTGSVVCCFYAVQILSISQ